MHARSCVPGKQRIVVESSAQSNRLGSWRIGRWNGNRRQSQRRLDFQRRSGGHHRGISWLRRAAQRVRRAIRNRKSDQGNKEQRKYQKPDSSRGGHRNSFPEPEVLGRETWLTVLGITLWPRMLIQSDRHNRDTICDIWNADPRLGFAHRKMLRGYNFETHGRSSPPTECAYQRVGAGFASSRNASVAGRSCETSIRNRARLRSELLFVSGQQSGRRGS